MAMLLRKFSPEITKIAAVQGISYDDAVQGILTGHLSLPVRLPLSPEEEQQAFEDELIEAMRQPIHPGYTGQYL